MNKYKLKDLLSIKNGKDRKELNDGTIPIFGSGGIMRYGDKAIYTDESILLPRKGTISNIQYVNKPFWTVDTIYYTVINKKLASPFYLYNFLKCLDLTKLNSGTGVPSMTFNSYYDLKIKLPDLPTQKSIAKVLSDLDSKIELNNKINRELEAMAKTLYDYWFVQFDFPNANGKPYKSSGGKMVYSAELKREIPEGWEVKPLNKITSVSNESINPMLTPNKDFKHYSIPTFDATKTFGIEKGDEIRSNKFTVAETDLLVSKLNPWFSRVIYPIKEDDLICSTEFVVWRTSDKNIKNFLYMVATGEHFIAHCTQSATGTSNSHKRVNPTVMMRYKIPYNADLINKYGSLIAPLLKDIVSKRIQNQHLTALRDWLLPMLMNGQVTVKEAEEN
jgi:type I restriction enzyme S subunit